MEFLDKMFNWIFSLPVLKIFMPLYRKRKDIFLYIFFGAITTIVSFGVYAICLYVFDTYIITAQTYSFIISVYVAFATNRIMVFNAPVQGFGEYLRQMFSFYGGRLFSFGVETLLLKIFVDWCFNWNEMLAKIVFSIVVLILNYILSKLIIFRKDKKDNCDDKNKKSGSKDIEPYVDIELDQINSAQDNSEEN